MNFIPKNGTYITYEELKTIPLLMQESPYNDEVLAFLGTVDCNLKTMITAYDDSALVAMTEEGMGCCIQAKLFMKKLNANVKVYSFEDKPCRTIYLVKKKYAQQTGVLKKICKFLKDYASAYPTDYDLEHCYLQSYDTELASWTPASPWSASDTATERMRDQNGGALVHDGQGGENPRARRRTCPSPPGDRANGGQTRARTTRRQSGDSAARGSWSDRADRPGRLHTSARPFWPVRRRGP